MVVLLKIFVKTVFFSPRILSNSIYLKYNIINVFDATFDQFNVSAEYEY